MIYCKESNLQGLFFAFVQKRLHSPLMWCQTGATPAAKSQQREADELFLLLMLPLDVPNSSPDEFSNLPI